MRIVKDEEDKNLALAGVVSAHFPGDLLQFYISLSRAETNIERIRVQSGIKPGR